MKLPFLLPPSSIDQIVRVSSLLAGHYPERSLMRLANVAGRLWGIGNFVFGKTLNDDLTFKVKPTASSISALSVQWLSALLQVQNPHSILELGTGYSSLVFATYAKKKGNVRITSLEHDPLYYEKQQTILAQHSFDSEIDLILAPIAITGSGPLQMAFYDESVVDRFAGKCDLIFVDGPVGSKFGGPGRKGSLRQGIAAAMQGGLILLHDAIRKEEFRLIQSHEKDDLKVKLLGIFPDSAGLAVFEKL